MFVSSSRLLAKYNLPSVVTLDGTTLPLSFNWIKVIPSFTGSQTIFYANFKPFKTMRPKRFFKLIISAFPATVSQRCKFELLWLISFAFKLEQPAYLFDLFSIRHTCQPLRSLHSGLQLHQPVFTSLFISCSFSHQAPHL